MFRDRRPERAHRAEHRVVGRILRALDAAARPKHVNLPGFHWHLLQGEVRWAIRVTGNGRITFAWDGADAVAVDPEDHH